MCAVEMIYFFKPILNGEDIASLLQNFESNGVHISPPEEY
jgi:hypothetical protein